LSFAIGIAHATGQRDGAVVGEHVAVQRIEGWVGDVGRDDALAQIVEYDDARHAAELAEGALVQLRPDARGRLPCQQAHRLPAAPERPHEKADALVLRIEAEQRFDPQTENGQVGSDSQLADSA
jgi:hypothetical protein